ncbi:MAG TPA: VanZ family protein [Candidatus Acidoferrales bacterium]|nr:VanZ family protein [Candidatus Acidoferrales bacterium]
MNLKKYPDFVAFLLPVLIWMAFIFTLSSIPGSTLAKIEFPYAHLIAHATLYGILYYLCYRALDHYYLRLGKFGHIVVFIFAFLVVGVYGMSDEYHQSFVPGRTEELKDLLIDLSAALIVLVGIAIIKKIRDLRHP